MDLRINETLQTGVVSNQRKRENETGLVCTVGNSADAVWLETAPTGPDKSGQAGFKVIL